jgi:hypothetical protein
VVAAPVQRGSFACSASSHGPLTSSPVVAADVVVPVVPAAAVVAVLAAPAGALHHERDPAAVGAAHLGLDVRLAGAQAAEARDPLEAGVARDLDAHRPALAVAQAERAVVAVDGRDRALVLADRGGTGGRGARGARQRGGGRHDEAERDDGLDDSHVVNPPGVWLDGAHCAAARANGRRAPGKGSAKA